MANNRIYLMSPDGKEYIFFGKTLLDGWYGGDIHLLSDFLDSCKGNEPPFIVTEGDDRLRTAIHIIEIND